MFTRRVTARAQGSRAKQGQQAHHKGGRCVETGRSPAPAPASPSPPCCRDTCSSSTKHQNSTTLVHHATSSSSIACTADTHTSTKRCLTSPPTTVSRPTNRCLVRPIHISSRRTYMVQSGSGMGSCRGAAPLDNPRRCTAKQPRLHRPTAYRTLPPRHCQARQI
jgi:hypothetical protein